MERDAKNSTAGEARGRGQIHRLVSQFASRFRRESSAAVDRWLSAPASSQRDLMSGRRAWVEQGDLWRDQGSAKPEVIATAESERSPLPTFDFSASEIVRTRPTHTTVIARTRPGGVAYAERRRGLHADNIARFLEVNQSVQGGRGLAYRVVQSIRGVSADYNLWKGSTSRVTFLLGA